MKRYKSPETLDITTSLDSPLMDFEVSTSDPDEVSEGTVGSKERDDFEGFAPESDDSQYGNLW